MADKKNMEETAVSIRMIYENKETKEKVTPFAMANRDTVLYAPVGSGREFRMALKDFLEQFKRLDDEPTVGRNI